MRAAQLTGKKVIVLEKASTTGGGAQFAGTIRTFGSKWQADRNLPDTTVEYARDMMDAGEFYQPEELLQMGVVDQVLPLEQVLPKSIEKARLLGGLPQEAFAMIKRNRVGTVEAEILTHLEEKEQFFIECWYSDEARERLRKAMEKF